MYQFHFFFASLDCNAELVLVSNVESLTWRHSIPTDIARFGRINAWVRSSHDCTN